MPVTVLGSAFTLDIPSSGCWPTQIRSQSFVDRGWRHIPITLKSPRWGEQTAQTCAMVIATVIARRRRRGRIFRLLQLHEFRVGLLQDGGVGVGSAPNQNRFHTVAHKPYGCT